MMNYWTNEDIEAILVQLNDQDLPFKEYEFSALGEGLSLLGSGASANVYEAVTKDKKKTEAAIKVIGFGSRHVDSETFCNSVEAQSELGLDENNVVKLYDAIELRVWIEGEHDVVRAEEIDTYEEAEPEGNCLHLQFILMEKLSPVFSINRFKHKLMPDKLEKYDEKEILKLANEIGTAINRAHQNSLIHRDIKLENIFYEPGGGHYKLGDFGIARTTDDGMASTVAFTKGYGAPEVVGTLEDKYDYTADIYSFGMMLYVLLNEIRFPESENYRPNVCQYVQGYIPPDPVNGSDELVRIVQKMISFGPDDRYQSMEEVLNEFDKLQYGHRIKYQREHRSTLLVIGTVFALMGAAVWKLSFMQGLKLDFSIWEYLFWGLCISRGILLIYKNETEFIITFISILIFGVGIYLLIVSGFSWWRLLLLIFIAVNREILVGTLGGSAILIANVTYLIMSKASLSVSELSEYRWMAVLLLSLAWVLLNGHFLLGYRTEKITKKFFRKNVFWIVATECYIILALIGWNIAIANSTSFPIYQRLLGTENVNWILSWNPELVGIFGAGFCVIWMIREWVLVFIEKKRLGNV